MAEPETIRLDVSGPMARVTPNRPEVLNAWEARRVRDRDAVVSAIPQASARAAQTLGRGDFLGDFEGRVGVPERLAEPSRGREDPDAGDRPLRDDGGRDLRKPQNDPESPPKWQRHGNELPGLDRTRLGAVRAGVRSEVEGSGRRVAATM